jgi:hypothetical protein
VVTKLSDFFGAVQLTGRPAGYPLGRGSFRYAATPQRAASSRGSQSPVLQSLLERGISAARRRATLRTAAAGASPGSCWRPQRSGAGRRPRADAMSGWNSVSSRQWGRRADACRAAGSLAKNNSPWAKTFYRRAFLRCPSVRRTERTHRQVLCRVPRWGSLRCGRGHGAVRASCCAVGPIDGFGGAVYLAGLAAHSRFDGRHCWALGHQFLPAGHK